MTNRPYARICGGSKPPPYVFVGGIIDRPENKKKNHTKVWFFGSPCWTRTNDLRINSPSLYRLS